MFDAQMLMKGSTVYSPWMARGGDRLRATLEVVAVSGATIKCELWTKNSDEVGDGSDADSGNATNITRNSVGVTTQEWSEEESANIGIKELVRYKFTVTGTNNYDWVLFRMLSPVWWDAVNAS